MKEKSPCQVNHPCPRRNPGCHGRCREYKAWRKKLDEFNAKVKAIRDEDRRQDEASFNRTMRIIRNKHKKG